MLFYVLHRYNIIYKLYIIFEFCVLRVCVINYIIIILIFRVKCQKSPNIYLNFLISLYAFKIERYKYYSYLLPIVVIVMDRRILLGFQKFDNAADAVHNVKNLIQQYTYTFKTAGSHIILAYKYLNNLKQV